MLCGTISKFSQLIVQISDTASSSHPLGLSWRTYDFHLGLIGKRVVHFRLVLVELFSLGVTAAVLRAKIDG